MGNHSITEHHVDSFTLVSFGAIPPPGIFLEGVKKPDNPCIHWENIWTFTQTVTRSPGIREPWGCNTIHHICHPLGYKLRKLQPLMHEQRGLNWSFPFRSWRNHAVMTLFVCCGDCSTAKAIVWVWIFMLLSQVHTYTVWILSRGYSKPSLRVLQFSYYSSQPSEMVTQYVLSGAWQWRGTGGAVVVQRLRFWVTDLITGGSNPNTATLGSWARPLTLSASRGHRIRTWRSDPNFLTRWDMRRKEFPCAAMFMWQIFIFFQA